MLEVFCAAAGYAQVPHASEQFAAEIRGRVLEGPGGVASNPRPSAPKLG
jgi:hypothetical protein